jgi:hypothetical protein
LQGGIYVTVLSLPAKQKKKARKLKKQNGQNLAFQFCVWQLLLLLIIVTFLPRMEPKTLVCKGRGVRVVVDVLAED